MRFLLDTHLLIWALSMPERLPEALREDIGNRSNVPYFSLASIWEIAIKYALRKADFDFAPSVVRSELLRLDYRELGITSDHVLYIPQLPNHHADPFDRLLVAQAMVENLPLFTADRRVAAYNSSIQLV